MERKHSVLALAVLALTISNIVLAASIYYYEMRIEWTVENVTIGVYKDSEATVPYASPYNLGTVATGVHNVSFWIKNEGNVAVNVTVVNEVSVNCTVSWSPVGLNNLALGSVEEMVLTLNVTDNGSYDFDFESVRA